MTLLWLTPRLVWPESMSKLTHGDGGATSIQGKVGDLLFNSQSIVLPNLPNLKEINKSRPDQARLFIRARFKLGMTPQTPFPVEPSSPFVSSSAISINSTIDSAPALKASYAFDGSM